MTNPLYIPVNAILVSVESEYDDVVIAPEGTAFYQDTTWRPDFHRTITGKVEILPQRINNDDAGFQGIKDVIRRGDQVYFHYLSVSAEKRVVWDEKTFYNVPLTSILCYKDSSGVMNPYGTWCLIIPAKYLLPEKDRSGFYVPLSERLITCKYRGIYYKGCVAALSQGDECGFWGLAPMANTIDGEEIWAIKENYIYLKYGK